MIGSSYALLVLTVVSFRYKVSRNGFPFFSLRTIVENRQLSFHMLSVTYCAAAYGIFTTSCKNLRSPEMQSNTAPLSRWSSVIES